MKLTDYVDISRIKMITTGDKFAAIEELGRTFSNGKMCADIEDLISTLKEREEIMSTGIGFGIAIPHAKISSVCSLGFAIGIAKNGIDFGSMDGEPVHVILLIIASENQHKDYLGLLSQIMNMLKKPGVKDLLVKAPDSENVLSVLHEYEL